MSESTKETGGWDREGKRRVKVFWIDEQHVLEAIQIVLCPDYAPSNQFQLRLKIKGEELSCEVVACHHDSMRRAIGFLLRSEKFDPVSEGEFPPNLCSPYGCEWEWVPVKRDVTTEYVENVSPTIVRIAE